MPNQLIEEDSDDGIEELAEDEDEGGNQRRLTEYFLFAKQETWTVS